MRQLQGLMPSSPPILRRRVRRRLPRQLLRNLGLFYLALAALTGLLVLTATHQDLAQKAAARVRAGLHWVWDKGVRTLPGLFSNLQFTPELSRSILAEGLPNVPTAYQAASGQLAPETLRSIVEAVTDYDLAEPESLVAGAFPGSRSGREPLRWDWIIQRGIQGYSSPLIGTGRLQTGPAGGEAAPSQGDVEVVISAPEYAALLRETSERGPSSHGAVPEEGEGLMVTYEAKLPAGGPQPTYASVPSASSLRASQSSTSLNPAERLSSLARVDWGSSPLIAIYHTHTGEGYRDASARSEKSYTWDFAQPGTGPVPGVVQVGERLSRELERRYGIPVVHSTKVHDYPIFAYSYANSEKTARMLLDRYPGLQLLIDIHRDEGMTMEAVGGRTAAGVLIVVGAGGGLGLRHVNWQRNLETAQLLKANFDRLYPGLCRGIRIKENARYNQHLHPGALLLEIGAHSDTLESALFTAELTADVLAETLWQLQSGSRGLRTSSPAGLAPGTSFSPALQVEIFEPRPSRAVPTR